MVKITEGSPENTLWYCRYCGGGLAVSELTVGPNHKEGLDSGDAMFDAEIPPNPKASIVRMKITEAFHI